MKGPDDMKNTLTDKLLITPMEACKLLGVGRTTIYSLIKKHTNPAKAYPYTLKRKVYDSIPVVLRKFLFNICRGKK